MSIREVKAAVPAAVWEIRADPGQDVEHGQELVVLESMKMEIPVVAPVAGRVTDVRCAAGRAFRSATSCWSLRGGTEPTTRADQPAASRAERIAGRSVR